MLIQHPALVFEAIGVLVAIQFGLGYAAQWLSKHQDLLGA
jgi:hypothetical protein